MLSGVQEAWTLGGAVGPAVVFGRVRLERGQHFGDRDTGPLGGRAADRGDGRGGGELRNEPGVFLPTGGELYSPR